MTATMANLGNQEVALDFQSIFDPHTCTRRGMCPVTQIRHQCEPLESHSLYFEVHGNGPQKIVFIMGMNDTSFAWLPQVDHFGRLEQYSTLVFDNRGVGMSGYPRGTYSTDEMADDTLCLLNYLQWTEDRSLHIVGISLGGMIAQKLAYCIPERIMSLSLVVTRPGGSFWANMPSVCAHLGCLRAEGMTTMFQPSVCFRFTRLLTTFDLEERIAILEQVLFTKEWLDSVAVDDPGGRTNREVQREFSHHRSDMTKPQTILGALGQVAAGLTHKMSPDQLAEVSVSVPKVLILSAAEDMLIPASGGEKLKSHMPEAEYQCWEKTSHAICAQHKERFNQLLERVFKQGREGKRLKNVPTLSDQHSVI